MSFKINNPLRYTDPGKKLPKNPYPGNTTAGLESVQSFKIPAFLGIENTLKKDKATVERFGDNARISADAKKRINTFNSASKKAPVTPYKAGGGVTRNDSSSSSVPGFQPPAKTKKTKSADEESRRDFTSNLKNQKTKEKTKKDLIPENNKTTTKTTTAERTTYNNKNLGKQDQFIEKDKNKQEFVPSAKKTNVKKETPKDNSRKAIRQRKTADKAAGVSKSQMRANKAKSKSEAFMAKAKASKDPSMRAQLKRKSDRLAKRAERKGGTAKAKTKVDFRKLATTLSQNNETKKEVKTKKEDTTKSNKGGSAMMMKKGPGPKPKAKMRTDAEIKKAYPGAVKVEGKINTWKYKGATLNPARFPVEKKGKTPKEAIELKGGSALKKVQGPGDKVKKGSAPVKKELSKMDILAKRYPGYIRRTPGNDARSTRNDRPNEYHLYNPKTGDSMTVRPDFPSMNKKKKPDPK